jgi:hypothetical protein
VPSAILVAILIGTMWLIALTSWRLRNWRPSLVLALGSAAIIAAGTLAAPFAALLQGALWIGISLFMLTRGEGLSSVGPAEYVFIETYSRLLRQIADLKRGALSHEPAAYVADYERVIEDLEALEAPSEDWANLKADATQELRRRLVMMRLGSRPSSETMEVANAAWSDIEHRFERMLKAKTGFWAGLPQRRSR